MKRVTSPVHKKVSKGAEKYIPLGRTLLGKIQQRLDLSQGSLTQLADHVTLGDGTEIFAQIVHGVKLLRILSEEEKEEESGGCSEGISGLRVGWNASFWGKYDRQWVTGNDLPIKWQAFEGVLEYSSSDFTGLMQHVAQILMGMPDAPDVFFPYSSEAFQALSWSSFGIFVQQKKVGVVPWVIWIKTDGVFAKVLPHCRKGVFSDSKEGNKKDSGWFAETFGFYPQMPKPSFFGQKGWKRLGDQTVVEQFYNKSALFFRCGWSFNSTGTSAVNTCYEKGETETDHWLKFFEYIVTIGADENGEPSTATMANTTSGFVKYVWNGNEPAPANLLVPNYVGFLEVFDLSLKDLQKNVLGDDGEVAPLYSYYDSSDALGGIVHVNETISEDADVNENLPNDVCLPVGVLVEDQGHRKKGKSRGVFDRNDQNPGQLLERSGVTTEYYTIQMSYPMYVGADWYPQEECYAIQRLIYTWDGTGTEHWNYSAIIPSGDRCAFYHYSYQEVDHSYSMNAGTSADLKRGVYVGSPGNDEAVPFYRYNVGYDGCSNEYATCNGVKQAVNYGADPIAELHGRSDFAGTCRKKQTDRTIGAFQVANGEPHDIIVDCDLSDTDPGTSSFGFCLWEGPRGEEFPELPVPAPEDGSHLDRYKTDRLKFVHGFFAGKELFSRREEYDPVNGWPGNIPGFTDGNPYAPQYLNGHRMYCWSDLITRQIFYSKEMFADAGDGLLYELTWSYPATTLPSSSTHSWIGIPGAI